MNRDHVPQSGGLFEGLREVTYAVDADGHYVLAESSGWDAKSIANSQYWKLVEAAAMQALDDVRAGRASPLAFYMACYQMDVKLLSAYVKLAGWRVRRHLRPDVFARLKPALRARYADVFDVPPELLAQTPQDLERFLAILTWANTF